AFCVFLLALPASIDIECSAIRDPNVCVKKKPRRGWPEVYWGPYRGPPARVYDAFGVAGRIPGEYCHQSREPPRRVRMVSASKAKPDWISRLFAVLGRQVQSRRVILPIREIIGYRRKSG